MEMEKAAVGLTFLDLPERARRSIYALAGLRRPCPIDLLSTGPVRGGGGDDNDAVRGRRPPRGQQVLQCWHRRRLGGIVSSFRSDARLCVCARLPLELLLVCRRVRDEALDVLLGDNLFVLRARHDRPDMLAPLLPAGIPAAHLARLARLVVRLNCRPCPYGHDQVQSDLHSAASSAPPPARCRLCGTDPSNGDPLLSRSPPASLRMLVAWEAACRRLGSALAPGRLDLTLICDVDAGDDDGGAHVASRAVGPLAMYLPRLRACAIRLGRGPDGARDRLARTARDAALALIEGGDDKGPSQHSGPFPFARLPAEIQLRILRYTHLGPAELAGYDGYFERLQIVNGRHIKGELLNALTCHVRKCCTKCTGTFMDW